MVVCNGSKERMETTKKIGEIYHQFLHGDFVHLFWLVCKLDYLSTIIYLRARLDYPSHSEQGVTFRNLVVLYPRILSTISKKPV